MQATTKGVMTDRNGRISYGFFFGMSFLIWLMATVALRLWGHIFFIPNSNLSMVGSFLLSIICLPLLVNAIFQWKVQPHQRLEAAVYLAIPGMLLDVVMTYYFPQIFPNILPTADGAFGAWLLWG